MKKIPCCLHSQAGSQHCHLHGCGTSGLLALSSAYYLWAFFWNTKRITLYKRKSLNPTKKIGCHFCINMFFSKKIMHWFQTHNLFFSNTFCVQKIYTWYFDLNLLWKVFAYLWMESILSCRIFLLHQSKGGGFLVHSSCLVSGRKFCICSQLHLENIICFIPGFLW